VLRTALQPRWIALLALALGLATVFATLGSWQLERSRRSAPAPDSQILELPDVAKPQTTLEGPGLLHRVRTTGTYRPEQQLEVVDRDLDGKPGSWVLTPLTVPADGGTATLAVVRGWVPQGTEPPAPPSGLVEVVGRLQGSEVPAGSEPDLGPDQVRVVSAGDLVNLWHPPLYAGYLVASDPVPPPLHAVPVGTPGEGGGFHLLNFSYALQWWVFAAFAVLLWWRMVRDAHLQALEDAAAQEGDDGAAPKPGDNHPTPVDRGARQ
jgi:surfeit locus 1 family protein